jgi:hypothetical protein
MGYGSAPTKLVSLRKMLTSTGTPLAGPPGATISTRSYDIHAVIQRPNTEADQRRQGAHTNVTTWGGRLGKMRAT